MRYEVNNCTLEEMLEELREELIGLAHMTDDSESLARLSAAVEAAAPYFKSKELVVMDHEPTLREEAESILADEDELILVYKDRWKRSERRRQRAKHRGKCEKPRYLGERSGREIYEPIKDTDRRERFEGLPAWDVDLLFADPIQEENLRVPRAMLECAEWYAAEAHELYRKAAELKRRADANWRESKRLHGGSAVLFSAVEVEAVEDYR